MRPSSIVACRSALWLLRIEVVLPMPPRYPARSIAWADLRLRAVAS